jgi:MarR family transcriptional regulator, organic hydroperoxide resistance regulator
LTSVGAKSASRVQRAFAELEDRALAGIPAGSVKQARRVLTALGEV